MDKQKQHAKQLFSEGSQFLHSGNASAALTRFQVVLSIDPSNPLPYLYAGAALHDLGHYEEAAATYRQALELAPNMGEGHNNLGNSLMALGRFSDAAESFSRAATILQTSPVPLTARATALQALGRIAESESDCRKALTLAPDFAAAHWNLALNLLLQGRYQEGWPEYEWRWRKPDFTSPCRHIDAPLWDGSPLDGRTILLHAEQGLGDAIQFVRYAPLVAACGGDVVLECHPQLVSLFWGVEGVRAVIPFGSPLPSFAFQSPLLSLPRIFGTTLTRIPSQTPYISISDGYRRKWEQLTPFNQEPRIALAWAGKRFPDPLRSCRLADLAPLADIQNAIFYSLQIGDGADQTRSPPTGMHLVDLTDQIFDFADTAAFIEQMDLVITIDTAVAHLAGALGKPTFLMLPFAPDWRWLLDRSDSPWYPGTRIFRQQSPGDWGEAVAGISRALLEGAMKQEKAR